MRLTANLIARTPCRGVRLPKADAHADKIRFQEHAELDRLAAAMPVSSQQETHVAGVLGLRRSEVVRVRVGRPDFLKRTFSVVETIAEVHGVCHVAKVKTKRAAGTIGVPPFIVETFCAHSCGGLAATPPSPTAFVNSATMA